VEQVQHDLSVGDGLTEVFEGVDVVFHVAALAGMWGPRERYVAVNVTGTENVVAACRAAGVPKLVYTGSPSVSFRGHDEEGVDESVGYAEEFLFYYSETKAIAERLALAANSPGLAVTALRPHLIYGPDDPHLLPRLIQRHRAGRLRILGDGENRVALTYVENAAAAHVSAGDILQFGHPSAGRPYFISDLEPVRVWDWLNGVFAGPEPPACHPPGAQGPRADGGGDHRGDLARAVFVRGAPDHPLHRGPDLKRSLV
jgi:nucleoside-diphosphate-sugar epimerase